MKVFPLLQPASLFSGLHLQIRFFTHELQSVLCRYPLCSFYKVVRMRNNLFLKAPGKIVVFRKPPQFFCFFFRDSGSDMPFYYLATSGSIPLLVASRNPSTACAISCVLHLPASCKRAPASTSSRSTSFPAAFAFSAISTASEATSLQCSITFGGAQPDSSRNLIASALVIKINPLCGTQSFYALFQNSHKTGVVIVNQVFSAHWQRNSVSVASSKRRRTQP